MYVYSDLKNKEKANESTYTKKHFYRKISIFNDNAIDKSISNLKESVQKKNQFIQKYNESQKVLTKRLKNYEDSLDNKHDNNNNKSKEYTNNNKNNLILENTELISKENKRRKKNYSLDFKNIVTIKNIEKDDILKYDYENKKQNNKSKENSLTTNFNNNNNENNILEKIKQKINSEASYKNLTNFNYELNTKSNKPVNNNNNNKKSYLNTGIHISDNSLDVSKILDEFIENIEKVYSIDRSAEVDNSKISNIFFKKINKKTNKNKSRNNIKLRNESALFNSINNNNNYKINNTKKLNCSNSFENTLTSESNNNNEINNSKSFESNKKSKLNKKNNAVNNPTEKGSEKKETKKDLLLNKLIPKQVNNLAPPKPKERNKSPNNNSNNKSFADSATDLNINNHSESIRLKTPQNIKSEMQKVFKMKKGEEFLYREINNDDELIKQIIIKLLSISKSDTEAYKYYRDIGKSLILQMKDKLYFWKNVIDFLYPKIFINKLDHKKAEKRILGEGLFRLNLEDLRYHRDNLALRLELRNSLYREVNEVNEKNKNEKNNEANLSNNKKNNNINNNNKLYSSNLQNNKTEKNENSVVDRNVIFRNAQQSNFAENAERLVKPSTLKKINTQKRIKLTQISRNHQMHNENVFASNSSNSRFNITNFNYFPKIFSNENSVSETSGRKIKVINKNDYNQVEKNGRIFNSQIYNSYKLNINDERENNYFNEVNYSNVNNTDVTKSNNNNRIDYNDCNGNNNKQNNILKDIRDKKNLNHSAISDLFVNSNNNKDYIENPAKKLEEKLISRRFRAHFHSMDLNSDLNEISLIHPNGNGNSNQNGIPNIINNNVVCFNSYVNESLTTNLENSSNLNVTEIDKNINNNNGISIKNNSKNAAIIFNNNNNNNNNNSNNNKNKFDLGLNKIKTSNRLVKINNPNPQIEISNINNLLEFQTKQDKNSFNKLSKINKPNQSESKKAKNFNPEINSKSANSIPHSLVSGNANSNNFNNDHYENFKINNKKESKAFKVIAPMLISSIPRYDL